MPKGALVEGPASRPGFIGNRRSLVDVFLVGTPTAASRSPSRASGVADHGFPPNVGDPASDDLPPPPHQPWGGLASEVDGEVPPFASVV